MALTAGSESLGRLCGRARTGCVANKGIVAKIDFEPTTECYQKTRKYPAASAQAKRYSWQVTGRLTLVCDSSTMPSIFCSRGESMLFRRAHRTPRSSVLRVFRRAGTLLLPVCSAIFAQSDRGTITGNIFDPAGAVVASV